MTGENEDEGKGEGEVVRLDDTIVELDFAPRVVGSESMMVDVEGYEGPFDLLLALAKAQKVDLAKISILALADQYLAFIRDVRRVRIEVAADYLVMAAWLAYLKSRLLLPVEEVDGGPSGEELAARLAFRLQRLQAMRNVSAALMSRNLLGRDVFPRGEPEGIRVIKTSQYSATIFDLLSAYAARRTINEGSRVRFRKLPVWSIKEARGRLERMIGHLGDWRALDALLSEFLVPQDLRPSMIASSFTATLELVREGQIELRQAQHYDPLYIRRRHRAGGGETMTERGLP